MNLSLFLWGGGGEGFEFRGLATPHDPPPCLDTVKPV